MEGPAAEAEALELDSDDLNSDLARTCPKRGPADLKAAASAAGPFFHLLVLWFCCIVVSSCYCFLLCCGFVVLVVFRFV